MTILVKDTRGRILMLEGDAPTLADLLHHNDLTQFQKYIVSELLSPDSGPEEFKGLIEDIHDHVVTLERVGWKVKREDGDNVTRPSHYDRFPIEPTYYSMMTGLDWCRGNALKYIFRFPFKNGIEDLRKCSRYIEMYVKYLDGDPDWSH